MKVLNFPATELVVRTAQIINEKIEYMSRVLRGPRKPFLLMLSGGSSLALLEHLDTSIFDTNTTICALDDRYSQDPKENNFLQIVSTDFYKKSSANGARFIDTKVSIKEPLSEYGERFNQSLKNWRRVNPEAPVIATMGIGSDGHIAGIMPYPEDPATFAQLFESATWAVGYEAKNKNGQNKNPLPLRLTPTMSFIRQNITCAISYVKGNDKKTALKEVLAEKGTVVETPARVLRDIPDVTICTEISL